MDIERRHLAKPPKKSLSLTITHIIEMTGFEEDTVIDLISTQWIAPVTTASGSYLFGSRDVYRLRKLSRLCNDLEISTTGGSIIVDLLDRISLLEARLNEAKKLI